jgi:hypothetical protein
MERQQPLMSKKKRPRDLNQWAAQMVALATGRVTEEGPSDNGKSAAAMERGRLGGLKGGPARAEKLSSKKRNAIAKKAAKARWEP